MKAHEDQYPTAAMSEVLEVSRSGYYKSREGVAGLRAREDQELRGEIVRIHQESRGHYGSPRILLALQKEGRRHGRKRVARLMAEEAIQGVRQSRRKVRTTQSNHKYPASPNLIKGMVPSRTDEVWVSDITYLHTLEEGWVYLAAILDLYSRKIVGWSMARSLESTLAIDALKQALATRRWQPGLILHSDRGVQYASHAYRKVIAAHGIRQSMSAKGNCYDNATMESFFGTFKAEEGSMFADGPKARLAVFDYVETYYNRSRIHTSLGGRSPEEFENLHHADAAPGSRPAALNEFCSGMGCSSGGRKETLEPEDRLGPPDSHDRESHHPGYPSEGCSPAEPSSVSPGPCTEA